MVSHHNRMKDSRDHQGLIPFLDGSKYNAYANAFCLKIAITNISGSTVKNVTFEIINDGFPDEQGNTEYHYIKDEVKEQIKISNANTNRANHAANEKIGILRQEMKNNIEQLDQNKITKVMSEFCKENIKLKPILEAAKEYNSNNPLIIYLIRNGNSRHEKPMSKKEIDSSLTSRGMEQANELGKIIKEDIKKYKNIKPLLCCSYLQRSQLTGLILLNQLGMLNEDNAGEKWSMKQLHDEMIEKSKKYNNDTLSKKKLTSKWFSSSIGSKKTTKSRNSIPHYKKIIGGKSRRKWIARTSK